MKKMNLFTVLLLGAVATACAPTNSQNPSGAAEILTTKKGIYGVSLVTASNALTTINMSPSRLLRNNTSDVTPTTETQTTGEETNTPTELDIKLEDAKKYIPYAQSILAGDGISVKELTIENSQFTNAIEVTTKDVNGTDSVYTFEYSETLLNQQDEFDEDDEDEDDKDEIEEEYTIVGQLIRGETTYRVEGEKQVEKEADENEIELSLKLIDQVNNSYVKIEFGSEQETGEQEKDFTYEVYNNNVLSDYFELNIENENNEQEIDIEVLVDGKKEKYEFKQDKNNPSIYSLKYEVYINGKKTSGRASYQITTTETGQTQINLVK